MDFSEFSIATFLLIMAAMALADVWWTLYFIDVEEKKSSFCRFLVSDDYSSDCIYRYQLRKK